MKTVSFAKCDDFSSKALFDIDFLTKNIPYDLPYFARVEPYEATMQNEEKVVIVGFKSGFIRMNLNRSTALDNLPIALVFQRFDAKGNFKKGFWISYLGMYCPKDLEKYGRLERKAWDDFGHLYQDHPAKKVRENHREKMAMLAAKEYGGYGWSMRDVPDCVFRHMEGTKFMDFLHAEKNELENRITLAHSKLMEEYGKFAADSSWLMAMFDSCDVIKKEDKVDVDDKISKITREIKSLKKSIVTAHRYEDMSIEYSDMKAKEKELRKLLNERKVA